MNLNKHLDFFNPSKIKDKTVHIIGCGAVGSNLAHQLTRLGIEDIILYDFDIVCEHNITNQMYTPFDVGIHKVKTLQRKLKAINPDAFIEIDTGGWHAGTILTGYVFLCVDSIELRKQILEKNMHNPNIIFVTDMRIALEEAQMYSAEWKDEKARERIFSTMQFKDDEVVVPTSGCGTSLNVLPTIQMIVSLGVMNFINYVNNKYYNYMSCINSIQGIATSYGK